MTPSEKAAATYKARKDAERKRFSAMLQEQERIRAALLAVIRNPDADPHDVVQAAALLKEYRRDYL